jgi:hypothetical protein
MVSSPPPSGRSKYAPLGSKAQDRQDRKYQALQNHLQAFDANIAGKVDLDLTARNDEFVFSGFIPFGLEHRVPSTSKNGLDTAVHQKSDIDAQPYAVVEKHIGSRTKAKEFVDQSFLKLAPAINIFEEHAVQRNSQSVDGIGVFEIPILTKPNVVSVIKTNRVSDAVQLFRKAENYQPNFPKKPSFLQKIAQKFSFNKKPDARPLLREEIASPEPQVALEHLNHQA